MVNFEVLSEPTKIYKRMLEDIKEAKVFIYLQTYIYEPDAIGKKFRDALIKKAAEGVKVRLLLDAWGSTADKRYFKKLIDLGGEVIYFREFRYVIRVFSKNHERNHRKLIIIDDKISYIGSANITASCLNWRELVMRLDGKVTPRFTELFMQNWESSKGLTPKKIKSVLHKGFEILPDVPSALYRITEKKYIKLIGRAKNKIMIETPYFVPSPGIRNAFSKAARKGVKIEVIIPYISDVRIVDMVRERFLGRLYQQGIDIYYYMPRNSHSKLLIVDDKFFLLGSSNLDYRSFIYQYEINIVGENRYMIKELKKYFYQTLAGCKAFNYNEWKSRSSFRKMPEMLISFIEGLL
ncbi:MAG: phosphatidylserine/phosphatidylglycerophosphate/cardiolipin synthase family protein [Nanoarchaeota archaeon]|nr:phosphatidylserine/phosphatidylglycerophosphate/cardiolipin synthase family protein [Nanoarchaeota archaeon]